MTVTRAWYCVLLATIWFFIVFLSIRFYFIDPAVMGLTTPILLIVGVLCTFAIWISW